MKRLLGRKTVIVLLCALMVVSLAACAKRQAQSEAAPAPEKKPAETGPELAKLSQNYPKIWCHMVSSAPAVAKDYPTAAADLQASLLSALKQKNLYKEVAPAKATPADAQTLVVKASITDLRIVSTGARIWGGAFAGSSYLNAELQLIDGATQKVVRQQALSSANNAWAASWTGGRSDYSMVSDMGQIVADYIAAVNPAR